VRDERLRVRLLTAIDDADVFSEFVARRDGGLPASEDGIVQEGRRKKGGMRGKRDDS